MGQVIAPILENFQKLFSGNMLSHLHPSFNVVLGRLGDVDMIIGHYVDAEDSAKPCYLLQKFLFLLKIALYDSVCMSGLAAMLTILTSKMPLKPLHHIRFHVPFIPYA